MCAGKVHGVILDLPKLMHDTYRYRGAIPARINALGHCGSKHD